MTSPSQERWQQLGDLLIQRRVELHPRYRYRNAFADETGRNWRLLYDIEKAGTKGRTSFPPHTITGLEAAYRLEPGAIWAFLDGEVDELIPRAEPEPEPEPPHFDDSTLQAIWDQHHGKVPDDVLYGALAWAQLMLERRLRDEARSA